MIPASDTYDMISDWLHTPVNAYLGSSYGQNLNEILQSPMQSIIAENTIKKMRVDVPILSMLPLNAINIYSRSNLDKYSLFIEVAGKIIETV